MTRTVRMLSKVAGRTFASRTMMACLGLILGRPYPVQADDCKPDVSRLDSITKQRQEVWTQKVGGTSFGASFMGSTNMAIFVSAGRYGGFNAINVQILKEEASGAKAAFDSSLHATKGSQVLFGFKDGGDPLVLTATDVSNETKARNDVLDLGKGKVVTSVVLSGVVSDQMLASLREALTTKQIDAIRVMLVGGVKVEQGVDDKSGRRLMAKFECFYQAMDRLGPSRLPVGQQSAQEAPGRGPEAARPPGTRTGKALRNDDVLSLVRVDLGSALIVSKIEKAPSTEFDVSTEAIVSLKKEGVSNEIIGAMMKRAEDQAASFESGSQGNEPQVYAEPPRNVGGTRPTGRAASRGIDEVVPFRTGESIQLGLAEGPVTLVSIQVTKWPKPDAIAKAQGLENDKSTVGISITESNEGGIARGRQYKIALLDGKGTEVGSGERGVTTDKGETDTHTLSFKVRTLDFPNITQIRIRTSPAED